MRDLRVCAVAGLVVASGLGLVAGAQAGQQAGTLTIAGQADQAALVRINGKSYVDVESLARITHGSIQFQGSRTILTLPGAGSAAAPSAVTPTKLPELSAGFLSSEIEALTEIREWRASLVYAIQNNYPVTDPWVANLRREAEAKLQLAVAAATTAMDQKALELLRNEFTNMQQMSDQFLAMHAKANYISPDSFNNNSMDQKILSCERALASMAATKEFQDEVACR